MEQKIINLNGKWLIKADKADILEKKGLIYKREIRKEDWSEINVPAHWQTEGYDYQGVVWYYKRFSLNKKMTGKKLILKFEGVDYLSQFWLNGVYLGTHEGDFDSFWFDISNIIDSDNCLFVKVESWVDDCPEFKQVIKGATYHWDCLPIEQQALTDCPEVPSTINARYPNPVFNPGGIWESVYLEPIESIYLDEILITPHLKIRQEKAYLHLQMKIFNLSGRPLNLDGEILLIPNNFQGESFSKPMSVFLKSGENYLAATLEVDQPVLWWSWDLGNPNLYQVEVKLNRAGQEVLFHKELIGFRQIKKGANWELYLNGERFFARGTNYLSNQFLSQSTPQLYDNDLALIEDANMNTIRVFAHMEKEYFYQECDRRGILIWQDLPFQWGYWTGPDLITRSSSIAKRFVHKLYNHPSIILWCCHSESRYHDYNKLDIVLENVVRKIDSQRPVWRNSVLMTAGKAPQYFASLTSFEEYIDKNTSVHWVGWYWGEIEDADQYNPLFVTEFGAQSVPAQESLRKFIATDDLWPPNWEEWRFRGFQTDVYRQNLGDFPHSLEELIEITQQYQQHFYKMHIETLRRKKYKNVNGLLQFHFVNTWPAIDWSIVDYYRNPKKAYYTVKEAFNPVLLTFTGEFDGNGVKICVWVVNDLKQEFKSPLLELNVFSSGRILVEDKVQLQCIEADSACVYLEKSLAGNFKELLVKGTLYQGDKELSSNQNLLAFNHR